MAYVQGKNTPTGDTVNPGVNYTLTLDGAPTVGDCLIMLLCGDIDPAGLVVDPFWTMIGSLSTGSYTNNEGLTNDRAFYSHIVVGGDTAVLPILRNDFGIAAALIVNVAEYSGLGAAPVFGNPTWTDMTSGSSASYPLPSQTPAAGVPTLLVGGWEIIPNYAPDPPAGWTLRMATSGGNRQASGLVDQIVAAPDGVTAYDGNASIGGGVGSQTAWHVFSVLIAAPSDGGSQFVIV